MAPVIGEAQTVRDLTRHAPTAKELVDTLRPRMRGIPSGSRGVGLIGGAVVAGATCEVYRQTRGIKPVADVAAIKVEFAFNSARLSPETFQTLRALGEALRSGELETSCFQIEGHTDSKGSDAYNLRLSQRRAQSVVQYLIEQIGVEADRLFAVGKGEQEPIADNSTGEGRQKNRRVQIVNLGYPKAAAQVNAN
jgi:outer membrane protein OmpA-like peptidoglycan-associated protein